jgi:hypothetical protein
MLGSVDILGTGTSTLKDLAARNILPLIIFTMIVLAMSFSTVMKRVLESTVNSCLFFL